MCVLTALDQSLSKWDGLNALTEKQSVSLYADKKRGTNVTI